MIAFVLLLLSTPAVWGVMLLVVRLVQSANEWRDNRTTVATVQIVNPSAAEAVVLEVVRRRQVHDFEVETHLLADRLGRELRQEFECADRWESR